MPQRKMIADNALGTLLRKGLGVTKETFCISLIVNSQNKSTTQRLQCLGPIFMLMAANWRELHKDIPIPPIPIWKPLPMGHSISNIKL